MKAAVSDIKNHENLCIDFFDRGRIASWVRIHPSLIVWIRNRIGREINGWQLYGNWSKAPGGIKEEYILDDKLRLIDETRSNDKGISINEGLITLRKKLNIPGKSIRLAGLSGVGKTRLAQALFDDRIASNALNPALVFYADIADNPQPDPRNFAEQLSMASKRTIIIIDNCNPELHRKMTEVCSRSQSKISLLTVEYDVREDIPEETHVFRLQTASNEVIQKLIFNRYPHISQVDRSAIANFSDGNARVAIALANTLDKGDSLSSFKDDHLFKRLFWQRSSPNDDLLMVAEVCSLLYSFEGTETGQNSELDLLASLIDKFGDSLYRNVKELKDRDLVQSRSNWRAVLPHAIANKLARRALEAIPSKKIISTILGSNSERLVTSFTRRLSFLHDCNVAKEIVSNWLAPNGFVGESMLDLNRFGITILENIAPVSPEETLNAIERAANDIERGPWFTSRQNPRFVEFVKLLRQIAYDPETYHRSVNLIVKFALSEKEGETNNPIRQDFKSLFYIKLSGTHANIQDRAILINDLLNSSDTKLQKIGVLALDAALEAWHFHPHREYSFGARPRDYGFIPKNQEEVLVWFKTFTEMSTEYAISDKPLASKVKKMLANKIRGMWTKAKAYDVIENCVNTILEKQSWNEGWIAVNRILKYDSKKLPVGIVDRLNKIKEQLKPVNLEELARAYALSDQNLIYDSEDEPQEGEKMSDSYNRINEKIRSIASLVAKDENILNTLLADLVTTHNTRLYYFGEGLANGSDDKRAVWNKLYKQIEQTQVEERQIIILQGFMASCAKSNPDIYNVILDEIVEDNILGKWLPAFQTLTEIDARGINRLFRSLKTGLGDINAFSYLDRGRSHNSLNDQDLASLLEEILKKDGGCFVVTEILRMRLHNKPNTHLHSNNLIKVAYNVLRIFDFSEGRRGYDLIDYELDEIAKVCFSQEGHADEVKDVCLNVLKALNDHRIFGSSIPKFLNTIAEKQPEIFLDTFLNDNDLNDFQKRYTYLLDFDRKENPLNSISDEVLITWCEISPVNRYSLIADIIQTYKKESGRIFWKNIVYLLFENAPELQSVLKSLSKSIRPSGWSGSRANMLSARLPLFEDLKDHPNDRIRSWASFELSKLQTEIAEAREWENELNSKENLSFE